MASFLSGLGKYASSGLSPFGGGGGSQFGLLGGLFKDNPFGILGGALGLGGRKPGEEAAEPPGMSEAAEGELSPEEQVSSPAAIAASGAPPAKKGLLSGLGDRLKHVTDTDKEGVTFGDKLFAMGSILQGDSAGGANYLQGRRNAAEKRMLRDEETRLRKGGAANIARNWGKDGLNVGGYLQGQADIGGGVDLGDILRAQEAAQPHWQALTPAGGGMMLFNPRTRETQEVSSGPARMDQYIRGPDGRPILNPDWLKARQQEAQMQRQVLVQNPLPRRSSGSGRRPGSYGVGEVDY